MANRNRERVIQLAAYYRGKVVPFEVPMEILENVDIVISSPSAPDILLDEVGMVKVRKKLNYRPIFQIDIAVPRDIDDGVNTLDNGVHQNIQIRKNELERCEPIVEKAKLEFSQWYNTFSINPILQQLNERIEEIR